MTQEVKWCTHLILRDGKIVKVVTHLSNFPENWVIHLKGDKIYTFEEFKESHPNDHSELLWSDEIIQIEKY